MKNSIETFSKSILAGMMIGIGGTVFLSVQNHIVGSLMFGIGLLAIVMLGFNLFTGAVGYLSTYRNFKDAAGYFLRLCVIWLGNLVGTGICAFLLLHSRVSGKLSSIVGNLVDVKMADSRLSLFVLAILCGMLMWIAVDTFKTSKVDYCCRMVLLFLCVSVFILSGFEHSIADMFYYWLSGNMFKTDGIYDIMAYTAGNSVGSFIIPLLTNKRVN